MLLEQALLRGAGEDGLHLLKVPLDHQGLVEVGEEGILQVQLGLLVQRLKDMRVVALAKVLEAQP